MRKVNVRFLLFITIGFIFGSIATNAQKNEYQKLNLQDLETLFFQNNFQLMAAKLEINKADAIILQEKLWTNPTLSISQINFWSNKTVENLPPIVGNWGNKQQINIEFEQMIETASKRKRRIAYLTAQKEANILQLEELARSLQLELHNTYVDFCAAIEYQAQIDSLLNVYTQLAKILKQNAQKQLIPQPEFTRIQAAVIDLNNKSIENEDRCSTYLNKIKILTNSNHITKNDIETFDLSTYKLSSTFPSNLYENALEYNIDILLKKKYLEASEKSILLEKANRLPNIQLLVNYDRGGNIMQNFVGFGVGFEIPVFNRNQGYLKIAKYENEQVRLSQSETNLTIQQEIQRLYTKIINYETALNRITESEFQEERQLITNYIQLFLNRQITLLEFLDFSTSYLDAKNSIITIKTNYLKTFYELKFITGTELK